MVGRGTNWMNVGMYERRVSSDPDSYGGRGMSRWIEEEEMAWSWRYTVEGDGGMRKMTRSITGGNCEELYVSLVGVTSWTVLHFKGNFVIKEKGADLLSNTARIAG